MIAVPGKCLPSNMSWWEVLRAKVTGEREKVPADHGPIQNKREAAELLRHLGFRQNISQNLCWDLRLSDSYLPMGMNCPLVISMETFGLN